MFQIDQSIWNQIAKEQKLKTKWAKRMFNMSRDKILDEIDKEMNELTAEGWESKAVLSYMVVKPYLLENTAIQNFVEDHPAYLGVFPDILDENEAVALMTPEYGLNDKDKEDLRKLLKRDLGKE